MHMREVGERAEGETLKQIFHQVWSPTQGIP